jgi:transglutaminase-like putative cysteine protease
MLLEPYLAPNFFTDSTHKAVLAYAQAHTRKEDDDLTKAGCLYKAVRDGFWYNPYPIGVQREVFRASAQILRPEGHCIDKANILAACARAVGIPARLGFANVTNHIGTEKLEKQLGTNLLVFHGYAELYLQARWVKATPAFNLGLCEKLNVAPLEFDGQTDSIFQPYNANGSKFMEYVHDYGTFAELPYSVMLSEWAKHYPDIAIGQLA